MIRQLMLLAALANGPTPLRMLTAEEAAVAHAAHQLVIAQWDTKVPCLAPTATNNSIGGIPSSDEITNIVMYDAKGDISSLVGHRSLDDLPAKFGNASARDRLSDVERERLDQAYAKARIIGGAKSSARLPLNMFRAVRRSTSERRCGSVAHIGVPVIVGDVAFVSAFITCPGRCGAGTTFALLRQPEGWKMLADNGYWVG